MKRKLLIALLCAAVLAHMFSLPVSARADESVLNYVEFSYEGRSYLLPVGSQVRFSDIYSALGLSGSLQSMGYSDARLHGVPPSSAWMDFVPHDDDNDNWWAESYRQLPSEQWVEVTLGGTSYHITLTPSSGSLINDIPASSGGYVYVGGIRWRVIGESSDQWLLISASKLGFNQIWVNANAYCTTLYDSFSSLEQSAVSITSQRDKATVNYPAVDLIEAELFLLSTSEVFAYFDSDSDRKPGVWWLRSQYNIGYYYGDYGVINEDGSLAQCGYTQAAYGARPSFVLNRSSILFESPAIGGKPAANGSFGAYRAPTTVDDRKLTLLDSARSGFAASAGSSSAIAGRAFAVNYSGAKTGTNEYVSAMLCDASGRALYYASLTPESSGSGTWDMVIPADLAAGSYTLKVFSEQRNGNNQTDYASTPVEIPLTVTPAYIVTVNNGTGGGNYAEGESVTITASAPETGKQFAGWTGADGLTFTSGSAATATATFTMPARAVEVTAVYEDIRYSIATDGAAQAYYHDSGFNQVFPAEATEGTELSLWVREDATPETGNYFTGEFTLDGESLLEYDENGENPRPATGFTMPAHAVTVGAVQAARETLALSFAPGETRALPMDAWMQLQYYETAVGEPPLLRYDAATGTEALDVNRDGKPDLQIAFDDDANCVNLTRLPACAAFGAFAFAFSGPTDHYGTITFTLPAPVFGAPDFTLPAALTTVEAEAFEGIAASIVDVPANCAAIGDHAFRSCPNLTQIRIPDNCALGTDVFEGCATVVVFGAAKSSAEYYCESHDNCVFVPVE